GVLDGLCWLEGLVDGEPAPVADSVQGRDEAREVDSGAVVERSVLGGYRAAAKGLPDYRAVRPESHVLEVDVEQVRGEALDRRAPKVVATDQQIARLECDAEVGAADAPDDLERPINRLEQRAVMRLVRQAQAPCGGGVADASGQLDLVVSAEHHPQQ